MMISASADTGVWCHPPVSLCLWTSFIPDTSLWLLVSGLIGEGHPSNVVLWIFYAYLKRAIVTEGSFYSSDYMLIH
jgi:hypothetical protein